MNWKYLTATNESDGTTSQFGTGGMFITQTGVYTNAERLACTQRNVTARPCQYSIDNCFSKPSYYSAGMHAQVRHRLILFLLIKIERLLFQQILLMKMTLRAVLYHKTVVPRLDQIANN